MYADDNNGRLVANRSDSAARGGLNKDNWVYGWLDFDGGNPDNTNTLFLAEARLGPYTRSVGVYKCPADKYPVVLRSASWPRVRSVAMNGYVGEGDDRHPEYFKYLRTSDLLQPAPANLWVFMDEHPDSINDGWLINNVGNRDSWADLPASYHNRAFGLAFADGHSEIKRWLENSTVVLVERRQHNGFAAPQSRDLKWLMERTSAAKR